MAIAMGHGNHQVKFGMVVLLGFAILCGCHLSLVSSWYVHKVHVHLFNNLPDGKNATIHCKSADDDLGEHILRSPNEGFSWAFHVNFWDTTLYWCNVWWYPSKGHMIKGSFNVYEAERDEAACGKDCNRFIQEDGIVFYYPSSKTFQLVYPWPNQ